MPIHLAGIHSVQFKGQLLLPGDNGPGLTVCLDLAAHHLAVESGSGDLGAWPLEAVDVERLRGDVFALTVAGEQLRFVADDTVAFAYSGVPAIRNRSGPRRARETIRNVFRRLLNPPEPSGTPASDAQDPAEPLSPEDGTPSSGLEHLPSISIAEPDWPELEIERPVASVPETARPVHWETEDSPKPADEAPAQRCPAMRSDGRRCESTILTAAGYCHPHDPRRAFEDKYQAAQEARARIQKEATGKLNRIYTRLEKAMRQVERGELDPEIAMAMASLARTMCAILDVDSAAPMREDG